MDENRSRIFALSTMQCEWTCIGGWKIDKKRDIENTILDIFLSILYFGGCVWRYMNKFAQNKVVMNNKNIFE